jgi:sugar phosphate isomerase/epimerase
MPETLGGRRKSHQWRASSIRHMRALRIGVNGRHHRAGSVLRPMRLAVQLYTLRHQLEQDLEATLAQLAEAGAHDVELAGLYGRTAAEMRAALDAAGLVACAAHVPIEELASSLEDAATLGVDTLVVPWVQPPETAAEADATVARIVAASEVATGAGLGFAYHNHDFEFRALEDGTDLWSRITAARVPQEPDVGWLQVAGRDPVAVIGELAGRCPLVHAKDVRRKADGTWEDVIAGDGELDWPAIAAASVAAGATRIVVELDNPSEHPVDDVALSLATLRDALP